MDTKNSLRGVINVEGATSVVPGYELCAICHRSFKGKTGLSVHQMRAHPVEYHADHQVEKRKKARWNAEDINRKLERAADTTAPGKARCILATYVFREFCTGQETDTWS